MEVKLVYPTLFGTKKQRGSLALWRKEHPEQVKEGLILVKRRLISEYKHDGCCKRCGYNEYPEILEFHHIYPQNKEFGIAQYCLKGITIDRLQIEMNKCILLCPNCHRILHYNLTDDIYKTI